MTDERSMKVELGSRSYPIRIRRGNADGMRGEVDRLREAGRPVALVVDSALIEAQGDYLATAFDDLPRLELPSGETTKSMESLGRIWDFLAAIPLDRTGVLFVCGGGVVGDLGGFAAASFLRGIGFQLVPTTLLSMVDSSVGGKTGINLSAGKNLVGAFYQPGAVHIDPDLLYSLSAREFRAGTAEVIKYGMLGNADLFELLEKEDVLNARHPRLGEVIEICCRQKAEVVRADEEERASRGGRALLNLGHTFGHAIEAVAGYGAYLHGEAVAVGLVLAARLSEALEWTGQEERERVVRLISRYGLPVSLREALPTEDLMEAMRRDKKVQFGKLRLVALESLGRAVTTTDVSAALIRELWRGAGAED